MTVKCAKDNVHQISILCDDINEFVGKHNELDNETGFMCDVVAFLCDYKRLLLEQIEEAELKI